MFRYRRPCFALTLLLVAAGAGMPAPATAANAEIAAIVETSVARLPPLPLAVTVSRIVLTPGASDVEAMPALRLVFVESGTLTLSAAVPILVTHPSATSAGTPGATLAAMTPTPAGPTPTPVGSSIPAQSLGPGDGYPVPIQTMTALRNAGTKPASILDVRIGSAPVPAPPVDLDVETLTSDTGITGLPVGAAAIALGRTTLAPGALLASPGPGSYRLVAAAAGGRDALTFRITGAVSNSGSRPVGLYVLSIEPATTGIASPPEPAGAGGAVAPGPHPVVLFISGCCRNWLPGLPSAPADITQDWLEHLAREGAIVIHPIVPGPDGEQAIVATLRDAMAELKRPGHAQPDYARFTVIGWSFGGYFGPVYVATAAAAGLPVPRVLFDIMPGDVAPLPDLGTIPASTYAIVLTGSDDDPDVTAEARRIWAALGSVPLDHRDFVELMGDTHGSPPLIADHVAPAAGPGETWAATNALDWYGTWKLADALMSCAFAGRWCDYSLGGTPEQRYMGTWSDGVPVAELRVTTDPGPAPPEATPAGSPIAGG